MAVEFSLLGDVQVRAGQRLIDVGHSRQQCVLVVLLVEANRIVPVDQLVDRVWSGRRLPVDPVNAVQTYVSLLRRAFAGAGDIAITRQPAGYRAALRPETVDVHRFRGLIGRASATGDDEEAAVLLGEALGLWRGEPLSGLDTPWINSVRNTLSRQRRAAHLDLIDVELRRGRHAALVAELSAHAAEHPLDERAASQFMTALYRSGRQAEALEEYRRIRERLVSELGIDPSPPLRRLHQQILTADPVLADATSRSAALSRLVPRQLPADLPGFTGRERYLADLDQALDPPVADPLMPAGLVVISGTAGVGKTALAVHWAHRVADRFRDGQLYIDLRGFTDSGMPMNPAEASRRLLESLGMTPDRIPANLDSQSAFYRSLLADRRMLIVLDNARDAAQVRPLLPGTPGCLVVVTSRNQLTGLAASDGAVLLTVGVLAEEEARELLARRLGARRAAAERAAVTELIQLCASLPLALSIAAARAAARPGFSFAALAAELRDTRPRLDGLGTGDPATDVRTVFSWSCEQLSDPAARMFRLLGLHPGPSITLTAAASLAEADPEQAREALAELVRAHLLTEPAAGRYAFHDLLRAYAAEQARHHESAGGRRAAIHRTLDYYLHTASIASLLLHPQRSQILLSPPRPGVRPQLLADGWEALEWFRAERQVLLATIAQAASEGFGAHAWQLPWATAQFFTWQGYWHDQVTTQELALEAARHLADPAGEAQARRFLGQALIRLGSYADASAHLGEALKLGRRLGSSDLQAQVHSYLSRALVQQGRCRDALSHAEQSVRLYREAGQRWGEANALNTVGWCHTQLGGYQEALACCGQALAVLRELGDRIGEAAVLDTLGYTHHHLGQYDEAIAHYEEALSAYGDVGGDLQLWAETLIHLGDAHSATATPWAAVPAWHAALAILENLRDPRATEVRSRLERLDPLALDP
jgi:DNA-binding SARP family transcriptional activator